MITLDAEVGDVVFHGKDTCALGVVPIEIDAGVQVTLPVFNDFIVFFEGILNLVDVTIANIFDNKVIDDEDEEDKATFVVPKTNSGGALFISVLG